MVKVRRLGHATLQTEDIEGQTHYYNQVLGLGIVERSKDRVFLASNAQRHAIPIPVHLYADFVCTDRQIRRYGDRVSIESQNPRFPPRCRGFAGRDIMLAAHIARRIEQKYTD